MASLQVFRPGEMDNPRPDDGYFASRCCVRLMHEVVSKFDPTKRELVESTGFGGIYVTFPAYEADQEEVCYVDYGLCR